MNTLQQLKDAILEEKLKQNEYLEKYGKEAYGDYYTGYICALSLIEGYVAEMDKIKRVYKCRNCKYLSEEPTTGSWHRCNCSEKPFRTKTSHLVYKWNHACKYFEKKEQNDG